MIKKYAALALILSSTTQVATAGNAYQCATTTPIDSLHNRSGWYVGAYTPQTGSYSSTINSIQSLSISAAALVDTTTISHTWTEDTAGNGAAVLPTGVVNLSAPKGPTLSSALTGLNTQSLPWKSNSDQSRWPALPYSGAMHALIIHRKHLKNNVNNVRRSDAIAYAAQFMEYRLSGSFDTVIDGVNQGQLSLGGEILDVEIVTEYIAPAGWGNNDYCWRLFNNNNAQKGFEVQMRPVVYVLGENHSQIANIPDLSGDYSGTIELVYDTLSTSRPVF